MDVCRSRMNRAAWNGARNVINQSKIRCKLGTFKPFFYYLSQHNNYQDLIHITSVK
jgi:hypothetical protein